MLLGYLQKFTKNAVKEKWRNHFSVDELIKIKKKFAKKDEEILKMAQEQGIDPNQINWNDLKLDDSEEDELAKLDVNNIILIRYYKNYINYQKFIFIKIIFNDNLKLIKNLKMNRKMIIM